MIQLIFNATPEKASFSFDWNSIIALFAGALIAVFIEWLRSRNMEQQERKEFKQIKKRIPEVIKTVKKGLDTNLLATELIIYTDDKGLAATGEKAKKVTLFMAFGKHTESISKELYDKRFDIKNFLDNYQLARQEEFSNGPFHGSRLILSPDFLNQIQKWG